MSRLAGLAVSQRDPRTAPLHVNGIPRRLRLPWQLRDVRLGAALAVPPRRRIGYVGWVGHGNLGDEASFLAYRRALADWSFRAVPSGRALRPLAAFVPYPLVDAAALGGGTLVGWPFFREKFEALLDAAPHVPAFMLGTGVEDPEFEGRSRLLADALARADRSEGPAPARRAGRALRELRRWAEALERVEAVAVRGPRSREVLAAAGIQADVVGDPALLLADARPSSAVDERVFGLNVGLSDGLWGDDVSAVVDAAITLSRTLQARGWKIRLVPLSPADDALLSQVARALGGRVELVEAQRLDDVLAAIRSCHVFVGEKLHSVVLASATYVPALALEYHPKCRDFQLSLGRGDFVLRTDRLDRGTLVERVDELADARDRHRDALVASVNRLRERLLAAIVRARSALAAVGDPHAWPVGPPGIR